MKELIQDVDDLKYRVEKLESLEAPSGFVTLQPTFLGTADTGNINVSGNVNAGTGLYVGGVQVLNIGLWANRPGSPVQDQEYTATDRRRTTYYWDGTRWLSTTRYPLSLAFGSGMASPIAASTSAILVNNAPDETYAVYVEKCTMRNQVNTTLNATDNWTMELWRQNSTPASTMLGSVSTWATGRVAGTPYLNTITVNTALSAPSDAFQFFISATKNNAPGTLTFANCQMWVRFIG